MNIEDEMSKECSRPLVTGLTAISGRTFSSYSLFAVSRPSLSVINISSASRQDY